MRTRPAAIATIVIAIGLALTTIGIAQQLPYTFGGHGDLATISADVWAHGTAISPSLVALVFVGILATIAMRPTRGGRRASAWLVVLAVAMLRCRPGRARSAAGDPLRDDRRGVAVRLGAPGRPDRAGPVGLRRDAPARRSQPPIASSGTGAQRPSPAAGGFAGRRRLATPAAGRPAAGPSAAYSCWALNVSQDPGSPLSNSRP